MRDVLAALGEFYGPIAPPPHDLFGFVVWEVLSGRALPSRRDIAWTALKRLPALTPDAMFRAPRGDLQDALAMLPGRDQRLDQLRAASGHLRRHRDLDQVVAGTLSRAVRALAEVPGLDAPGRVRALLFPGGHGVAPADESTLRVIARLHGLRASRPRALYRQCRRRLAADCDRRLDLLRQAAIVLDHHGTHACADAAPHCGVCPLAPRCRHAAGRTDDQLNDATRRRSDFT
jgi:endonuclease III